METTNKTHPLIITAAAAVIIASSVAIASMTGLIGKSQAENAAAEQAAQQAAAQEQALSKVPMAQAQPKAIPAPVHRQTSQAHQQAPVQVADASSAQAKAPACADCGKVTEVREYEKKGEGSGLGAVAGGVAGALLGHQVGGGNGRTAMTILGAAGGAYAGNAVEKNVKSAKGYEVSVRFNDGTTRSFNYTSPPSFRSGDNVKVVNGELVLN